jgi:hypothetical protein
MKKLLMAGVATLGLAAAATPAQAAMVAATGPTNSVIGAGVEGWLGETWFLIAGAATTIDVYFVGIEAGANNTFTLGPSSYGPYTNSVGTGLSSLFGGAVAPTLLVPSPSISPGLIPFQFDTDFGGGGTVTNAANPLPLVTPNFFSTVTTCGAIAMCSFDTTVDGVTASSGNTLLLALDDGGPIGTPDDDHDDLVIIIKISNGTFSRTPVPEPATLALLGAGLLGLGFAARGRKA